MSAPEKKISVNLVKNTLSSQYPEYSVGLGNLSSQDYEQIKNAFITTGGKGSKCMHNICMNYQETMIFGPNDKAICIRHLDLSGMPWMSEDKTPLCQNCSGKTDHEKMNCCGFNMRNGNCRDPLIRRTLGAALFPQLYANQNQK